PHPKKKQKIGGGIIAIVALVFCLGIAGVGYFGFSIMNATKTDSPLPNSASVLPTNTPRPPQSLPPTWTPTPTATIPTPSEDGNSTNTSAFQPGDPTATPLGTDITDPNFIEGKKAYEAGNYDEVIALMNAVIESNPNLAPPYRYRGTAYWYLGDCVSGLENHEKALSINPDYAKSWAERGLMHSCLGNDEQELEDYKKALSLDPSLAFVHHNLGVYYYQIEDYERSLEEYSLSVAIDPNRAGAWSGRSEALLELGRFEECVLSATKSLEINPEEWIAYGDRARCRVRLKQHKEVIEDYKIYVEHIDVCCAIEWYNYGISQLQQKDLEGAVVSNSMAIELDSTYYKAYINRGVAYTRLHEFENAIGDFDSALEFGDIPLAYSGRGAAYMGLEEYQQAISNFEKSQALLPNNPEVYCQLSYAYFNAERYQDSLEAADIYNDFGFGIFTACDTRLLYETQARSYYALEDYDQAILYMDKALDIYPYWLGFYYRGIIFHDAERNEEAVEDLEIFLKARADDLASDEVVDAEKRLKLLK
ncbi:MAG: hypothetical protein HOG15_00325, partial [Anaerolineae bacterium]|nr:hypothetical protein [Anaerolineae bacterium]